MKIARLAAFALLVYSNAFAAVFFHRSEDGNSQHPAAISLHERLYVNPLITEPDTMEIEWGGAQGSLRVLGAHRIQRQLRFAELRRHGAALRRPCEFRHNVCAS
jgi:hypothetical protein